MLILADDQVEVLTEQLSQRRDELESFADISIEFGLTMRNAEKNPIEHFGYADGVSQPIFFESDVKKKDRTNWDPRAGPNLVLVKDPYGGVPTACGTYFVFRKLEQNVRAFKDRERELAKALSLHGSDDERAGAMVVGRFENGTPLEKPDSFKGRELSDIKGAELQAIKRDFRNWTVILDMPPMLASDDVIAMLPQIDCVLLVAAVGNSTLSEIKECNRHLQAREVVRLVLNKSSESTTRYVVND